MDASRDGWRRGARRVTSSMRGRGERVMPTTPTTTRCDADDDARGGAMNNFLSHPLRRRRYLPASTSRSSSRRMGVNLSAAGSRLIYLIALFAGE
jgi:hypothetical protein